MVPADCGATYISDPENRELLQKIPLMIIFKGVYHLWKYFDNDIDGDTLFTRSEPRITIFTSFQEVTEKSTKGRYRLLIFDGHGSHLTQNAIDSS